MRAAAWIAAAMLAACGEGPGKAWLVDRPRVLGARVEAVADPERASVGAGERARLTWLVAGPGAAPRVSWAFAACVAPSGNFAQPRCDGPALASGSGTSDGTELVTMDLEVPTAIDDAGELLVVAAFCESDEPPSLEPRGFTAACASGREPLLASTLVRLATKGPNRNPVVGEDSVSVPTACVAPGGPEQAFVFRLRGTEREPGETLLVSHVVTAGELDRLYSTFEAAEPAPREISIPWTPPAQDADVRVFFVLRDGRGGTTFVRRTVCVKRG